MQVFENRGAMMGASNPHPHCQIWATEHVPDEPATESEALAAYHGEHGSCLLCDYLATETAEKTRIVCENEDFLAVVPWWAVWPFETLVLAKKHVGSMPEFSEGQRTSLAAILKQTDDALRQSVSRRVFRTRWASTRRPRMGREHPEWHFPRALLSAAATVGHGEEVHGGI